jgi:hypothetical protein
MKELLLFSIALLSLHYGGAQTCSCETEFRHIKDFMEANYAGFKDKEAQMTVAGYGRLVKDYLAYSKGPHSTEHCLLIITSFLDHFKDEHVSVGHSFDPTMTDSFFISQRELINIPEKRLRDLQQSTTPEGIYYFKHDSSYKIAVIKDKTPLHDYIGVIVSSKLPGWKPGMLKFEGKFINDSVLKGVLYMRNQLPKVEWFWLGKDLIGGDWQREGAITEAPSSFQGYEPVASRKLNENTLYIKIATFGPSNAKNIDSVIAVNKANLASMPNLVLDLRNNGGGADFAFSPLLPYLYTGPVRYIGADVWSTDSTVAGWKRMVDNPDIPEAEKIRINQLIAEMEAHKGQFMSHNPDEIDSSRTPLASPSKVIILINGGCASTTEEFLLAARQSGKVRLLGQNTSGTLDYSNVVSTKFICMPYILGYPTTRSRRLNVHEGIDNAGIKPDHYLDVSADWIEAALAALDN